MPEKWEIERHELPPIGQIYTEARFVQNRVLAVARALGIDSSPGFKESAVAVPNETLEGYNQFRTTYRSLRRYILKIRKEGPYTEKELDKIIVEANRLNLLVQKHAKRVFEDAEKKGLDIEALPINSSSGVEDVRYYNDMKEVDSKMGNSSVGPENKEIDVYTTIRNKYMTMKGEVGFLVASNEATKQTEAYQSYQRRTRKIEVMLKDKESITQNLSLIQAIFSIMEREVVEMSKEVSQTPELNIETVKTEEEEVTVKEVFHAPVPINLKDDVDDAEFTFVTNEERLKEESDDGVVTPEDGTTAILRSESVNQEVHPASTRQHQEAEDDMYVSPDMLMQEAEELDFKRTGKKQKAEKETNAIQNEQQSEIDQSLPMETEPEDHTSKEKRRGWWDKTFVATQLGKDVESNVPSSVHEVSEESLEEGKKHSKLVLTEDARVDTEFKHEYVEPDMNVIGQEDWKQFSANEQTASSEDEPSVKLFGMSIPKAGPEGVHGARSFGRALEIPKHRFSKIDSPEARSVIVKLDEAISLTRSAPEAGLNVEQVNRLETLAKEIKLPENYVTYSKALRAAEAPFDGDAARTVAERLPTMSALVSKERKGRKRGVFSVLGLAAVFSLWPNTLGDDDGQTTNSVITGATPSTASAPEFSSKTPDQPPVPPTFTSDSIEAELPDVETPVDLAASSVTENPELDSLPTIDSDPGSPSIPGEVISSEYVQKSKSAAPETISSVYTLPSDATATPTREASEKFYRVKSSDNLWNYAEGDVEGVSMSPELLKVPEERRNEVLAFVRAELVANADWRDKVGITSGNPDLVYPYEIVNGEERGDTINSEQLDLLIKQVVTQRNIL